MSEQKELYFFTQFYDYGIGWYSEHFPPAEEAVKYKAVGEITPTYIADPDVPSRIRAHMPDSRFVVILRNPVDRAISEYTKRVRDFNFKGTFDEFVQLSGKNTLERGYYAKQLKTFFRFFSRNQFLVLIFEEAVSNHPGTIQKLAAFLEIDPSGFDLDRMKKRVNPSYLPRVPLLYSSAVGVRRYLVQRDLGRVLTMADKIGLVNVGRCIFRFRGPRAALPKVDEGTRKRLKNLYEQEIGALEKLVDFDLSIWRN